MLKHVVMWKLKAEAEGNDKATNARLMKEKLESLLPIIPELLEIEVGINILEEADSVSNVALITSFGNHADMQTYASHPAHLEVVEFIKQVVSERRVADYRLDE